jgi:hypothetical protein
LFMWNLNVIERNDVGLVSILVLEVGINEY